MRLRLNLRESYDPARYGKSQLIQVISICLSDIRRPPVRIGSTERRGLPQLREMLAEAVRNTQPQTETKPLPKAKKGRR